MTEKQHGGYWHGYCRGCDYKRSIKDGYCDACRPNREAQLNEIADNLASGNFTLALEGYINKSRGDRQIIEKLQEHVHGRDQRITELEAENARLRDLLGEIAETAPQDNPREVESGDLMTEIARAAEHSWNMYVAGQKARKALAEGGE